MRPPTRTSPCPTGKVQPRRTRFGGENAACNVVASATLLCLQRRCLCCTSGGGKVTLLRSDDSGIPK